MIFFFVIIRIFYIVKCLILVQLSDYQIIKLIFHLEVWKCFIYICIVEIKT
nr:MAG TPA: hypothetical protein [Caudoviricetes sp.]